MSEYLSNLESEIRDLLKGTGSILLGIAGTAGAGKSTLAQMLCEEWYSVGRKVFDHEEYGPILPFAGPLKKAAAELWDLSTEQLHGDLKEVIDPRWKLTPRAILQQMGTDHARRICKDVHLIRLASKIKKVLSASGRERQNPPGLVLVVPDMRFLNEFDSIRNMGGATVYVSRPCIPPRTDHSSEADMLSLHEEDAFDYSFGEEGLESMRSFAMGVLLSEARVAISRTIG